MSGFQKMRLKGRRRNRRLLSYLLALIIGLALLVSLSIGFVAASGGVSGP